MLLHLAAADCACVDGVGGSGTTVTAWLTAPLFATAP